MADEAEISGLERAVIVANPIPLVEDRGMARHRVAMVTHEASVQQGSPRFVEILEGHEEGGARLLHLEAEVTSDAIALAIEHVRGRHRLHVEFACRAFLLIVVDNFKCRREFA